MGMGSGSGMGGSGSMAFGQSGGMGQQGVGVGGQARRPGDFVGASAQPGQNFVGAAQASPTAGQGLGLNGLAPMGAMGAGQIRPGQGAGNQGAGMGGAGASSTPRVRVSWSVGFDHPAPGGASFNTMVSQRLIEAPALHWHSPAQVEVQGHTAVLRGVVATDHDRALAERVVRLEAGIDQVQNLIVVAGSAANPGKPLETAPGDSAARSTSAADSGPKGPTFAAPAGTPAAR